MKRINLPIISGRFVALVALLSVVMLILPIDVWSAFWLINLVLLGLFIADYLFAVKPAKLEITRDVPEVIPLGAEAEIKWRVKLHSNRKVLVEFADQLPPSFNYQRRKIRLSVRALETVIASTSITPQRRGKFTLSELSVRVFGPLGLAARQYRVHATTDRTDRISIASRTGTDVPIVARESIVRVYPSFKSKREAELRVEKARVAEVGTRSVRGHGGGTDFEQLREYSIDDDYRYIDWAATARSAKPVVRTYRAERNQNVLCLLDCGRVMAGQVANVARLEHAMDAVMAVSTVATRLGDKVGLLAFDKVVQSDVGLGHGPQQVARIIEAIYQLEPVLAESNYRDAFVQLLNRFRRRGLIVLFTELSEQSITESLLPALKLISKRNLIIIASISDPDVTEWSRATPTEANKAFKKAASVMTLQARQKTKALLTARGAIVVDAVPGKLAAAASDAYLKVKATGRL